MLPRPRRPAPPTPAAPRATRCCSPPSRRTNGQIWCVISDAIYLQFYRSQPPSFQFRLAWSRHDHRAPQEVATAIATATFVRTVPLPGGAALAGAGRGDAGGRVRRRADRASGDRHCQYRRAACLPHGGAMFDRACRWPDRSGRTRFRGTIWIVAVDVVADHPADGRGRAWHMGGGLRAARTASDERSRRHGVRPVRRSRQILECGHRGLGAADAGRRRTQSRPHQPFCGGWRIGATGPVDGRRGDGARAGLSRPWPWSGMGAQRDLEFLANLVVEPVHQEPGLFRLYLWLCDAAAMDYLAGPDFWSQAVLYPRRLGRRRFIRQPIDTFGLGKPRDRKFAELAPAAGADAGESF